MSQGRLRIGSLGLMLLTGCTTDNPFFNVETTGDTEPGASSTIGDGATMAPTVTTGLPTTATTNVTNEVTTDVSESMSDSGPATTDTTDTTDTDNPTESTNGCPVEICDGLDNDCDGFVDEWSPMNTDCPPCTTVTEGNTVYYLCTQTMIEWPDARMVCMNYGADLVTLDGERNNDLVASEAVSAGILPAWIGLHDQDIEGVFVWVDASPLGYENWLEFQPDNFKGNENCVEMEALGFWNDIPCDLPLDGFICEGSTS